jgi:peroxiredoxin Q/BCP
MALQIGSKAPEFKTNDQDGKEISLNGLKGKKFVLYFYPKDMTPGCTAESCNLRDNYSALQKAGYEVFGISSDDAKSHQKFIAKEKLPFRLLADTDKSVHGKFGTWVEKSMYGRKYMGTARVTFVIDGNGMIENIIDKVDTKDHTAQILGKPAAAPAKKKTAPAVAKKKPAKKAAPAKKVVKKAAKKKK